MMFGIMKAKGVQGWNVFKQIFADNWEGFKREHPLGTHKDH